MYTNPPQKMSCTYEVLPADDGYVEVALGKAPTYGAFRSTSSDGSSTRSDDTVCLFATNDENTRHIYECWSHALAQDKLAEEIIDL